MRRNELPKPRLAPLPSDHDPELAEYFKTLAKRNGYLPNSQLTMQRRPKLLKAYAQLSAAIWDPEGSVDLGLRRLIGHVASRAAGCQYCMAHTAGHALHSGIDDAKLAAVWEYRTSPLFNAAERAALDMALAAGQVPNDVTDKMFTELRTHWNEGEIVEIVAVIALFGFLNRWNDTMATPLESDPVEVGEKHLARMGWSVGKHARTSS
jgi:uncharacterized peroxidase-related enzyme